MRTMVKFTVPTTEESNALIREGGIAQKMETILGKLQPEAAYFCPIDGKRGGVSRFQYGGRIRGCYQAGTFLAGAGSDSRNRPCYERG